jgi:hypothetical protein
MSRSHQSRRNLLQLTGLLALSAPFLPALAATAPRRPSGNTSAGKHFRWHCQSRVRRLSWVTEYHSQKSNIA